MGHHRAPRGQRRATSAYRQAVVTTTPADHSGAGKRRAASHAAPRSSFMPGLPSAPIVAGVAALAISAGGAMTAAASPALLQASEGSTPQAAASPVAANSVAGLIKNRRAVVSRDSRRVAKKDQKSAALKQATELKAAERETTLAKVAVQAEQQSEKIEANQWVLPVSGYRLTGRFGQSSGLWSSTHTGLDFAVASGTPIHAVANGTITATGYDGAYGNKTVLTLEDGTEVWFCHQTAFNVSVGDAVNAGDVIGSVGSTGNSTGPHLHLEIRPGADSPIDPFTRLIAGGLNP